MWHKSLVLLSIFFLIISIGFSLQYSSVVQGNGQYSASTVKQGACSINQFSSVGIAYDYSLEVVASTPQNLVSPTTSLDFSVTSGSEKINLNLQSNPGIIYTTTIYGTGNLIDYPTKNTFSSSYYSSQDFGSFENDYNACELRIFSSTCSFLRGYEIDNNGNPVCVLSSSYRAGNFNKFSSPISNPGDYVYEKTSGIDIYQDKKQLSYTVCNGEVSFSSLSNSIPLDTLAGFSSTLPSSCFSPDSNGLYKDSCTIQYTFNAKCYPIFKDQYKNTESSYYIFYSPFSESSQSSLTITNLCHGTLSTSLDAPPVEISPLSSTSYSFTVINTGDIPSKINSPNDIQVSNGYSFTPSSSLSFPVEIPIGGSAVITGTLTAPSSLSDFTLSVITYPDKNAVSCDGNSETTTVSTVTVSEPCSISLDITNNPTVCRGDFNRIPVTTKNTGSQDVIVNTYRFELGNSPLSSSQCSGNCERLVGEEKTENVGVDVPLTNEKYLYLYVDYSKIGDASCKATTPPKQIPILDCLTPISFDLYPANVNFFNTIQNQQSYATFDVFNDDQANDESPLGSTATYTLSSGTNSISETFQIDALEPGNSQTFTTQPIECVDSITLRVEVNPSLPGDTNPDNNIIEVTQQCSPPQTTSGYCKLYDSLGNEISSSTVYPSNTYYYDLRCFILNNGVEEQKPCVSSSSLTETNNDPDINGNLVSVLNNLGENEYKQLEVIAGSGTTSSSQEIFDILISDTGNNIDYSCSFTANGDTTSTISGCIDYI